MNSPINLNKAVNIEAYEYKHRGRAIFIKNYSFEELVGEEIAKFLNIPCVHYEIGTYLNHLVLFSECFYNKVVEKYLSGSSLLEQYYQYLEKVFPGQYLGYYSSNNLTDIWAALEYKFSITSHYAFIPSVMRDLIKIFCYDLLLNNNDRHDDNWGVIIGHDSLKLAPAFDNETRHKTDMNHLKVDFSYVNNNKELLAKFCNVSTAEYIKIFYEMFDKLTVQNFEIMAGEAFNRASANGGYGDPVRLVKEYHHYRKELEPIVKKYRRCF